MMNQKDRDSLTALLKRMNDRYQFLSHKIHWTSADSACLDTLRDSKEQQRNIGNRIEKVAGPLVRRSVFPSFMAFKAWQRTKAVYSFHRELVEEMVQSEDTTIATSLLERLPFKDMLFFFPKGVLPKVKDEETAGIYIHIEYYPEYLWVFFNYLDRIHNSDSEIHPGIAFSFPITNGMKITQVFESQKYKEWLSAYKTMAYNDRHLNEQETEESILAEKKALYTAIGLLYYLSSKDADIKPIKRNKKHHKSSSKPSEDNAPAVELHEVGAKYSEIVYRRLKDNSSPAEGNEAADDEINEEASDRIAKNGKKRRPHVRRAHWQHYWTGKGRTTLEVRWKSDLFVGVNRDNQATVVYDVTKESLKGKRNPNTSKKKTQK